MVRLVWLYRTSRSLHLQGSSFATGLEVSDKRKRVLAISTGSKAVDTILGGKDQYCLDTLAEADGR